MRELYLPWWQPAGCGTAVRLSLTASVTLLLVLSRTSVACGTAHNVNMDADERRQHCRDVQSTRKDDGIYITSDAI